MAEQYWYNKTSTASEIKTLNTKYNDIVKAALAVGELLKQYVCVKNKWNDENAVVFADWWNQNTGAGGAGGALKWDSANKRLYMASQVGSQSDGEDKIRHVVSMAGAAYYVATCKSFNALTSSYSKEMKNYDAYVKAAKQDRFTRYLKNNNYRGKEWPKLMKSSFVLKEWKDTKLSIKPGNKVTTKTEVVKMANELAKRLTTLNNKVDTFNEEITKVACNTNTSKYWGFSSDVTTDVVKITKELSNNTSKWLKSFATNTNVALVHTNDMVAKDLAKLKNVKFS